jgi:hypothetical protein
VVVRDRRPLADRSIPADRPANWSHANARNWLSTFLEQQGRIETQEANMTQLLDLATRILTGLSPLVLVAGLLALAAWRDRRRLAETARQVRLTDALADEMGAIVAPVVKKRLRGWRIVIPVPVGRPALVAHVLAVVQRTLGGPGSERYEIVLSPRAPAPGRAPRSAERRLRVA